MKTKIKIFLLNLFLINLLFFGWLLLEEKSVFGQELFFAVAPIFIILFLIFRKNEKSFIFLSLMSETILFLIFKKNQAAQNLSNMFFLYFILLVLEKTVSYLIHDSYED